MYISRRALFSEQTTSITYVSQQNTSKYVHVRVHVLSLKNNLNMYKKLKSMKENTCIGSWLLKKNIPQNEDDMILPRHILSFFITWPMSKSASDTCCMRVSTSLAIVG